MKQTQSVRVRIGIFELDLRSGELRAKDQKTVLQEQPLQKDTSSWEPCTHETRRFSEAVQQFQTAADLAPARLI